MKVGISPFTESILGTRTDDFRISILMDVVFNNTGENREFEKGIKKYNLRKGRVGDTITYAFVNDDSDFKKHIETNIVNINKHKEMKVDSPLKISTTWVNIITIDNDKLEKTVYCDVDSKSINDIIADKRKILAVVFCISYTNTGMGLKPEEIEDDFAIEWTLMSPGDMEKIAEYDQVSKEIEAEGLKSVFGLNFSIEKEKPVTLSINR